jgi:hypothetical protein
MYISVNSTVVALRSYACALGYVIAIMYMLHQSGNTPPNAHLLRWIARGCRTPADHRRRSSCMAGHVSGCANREAAASSVLQPPFPSFHLPSLHVSFHTVS